MKSPFGTYELTTVIDACLAGDPRYQRMMYDTFVAKMFAVCRRYAQNDAAAEDMLQDGFVRLFKNLHKFRGEGSFAGWVHRIFVNTAIEHYRKVIHMYPINEFGVMDIEHSGADAVDKLAEEDVMACVQELSDGYRTIFNLYVVDGFSHKEIAQQLQISEGTSKSQLARARYILQDKIKQRANFHWKDQMQ